jgi:hypothetical protein
LRACPERSRMGQSPLPDESHGAVACAAALAEFCQTYWPPLYRADSGRRVGAGIAILICKEFGSVRGA